MWQQQRPLNDETKQKIRKRLDDLGIAMRCPACQSAEELEDFIGCAVAGEIVPVGNLRVAQTDMSSFYAYVLLLCQTCGHTRFFNAVNLGIIDPTPGDPEPPAPTPGAGQ
jgi:hypothetical protein